MKILTGLFVFLLNFSFFVRLGICRSVLELSDFRAGDTIYIWGTNFDYEIGRNNPPILVVPVEIRGRETLFVQENVKRACQTHKTTFLLMTDNCIYSFGSNYANENNIFGEQYAGLLGGKRQSVGKSYKPEIIHCSDSHQIIELICGHKHSLILTDKYDVLGIGLNYYEELNQGHSTSISNFTTLKKGIIENENITMIDINDYHPYPIFRNIIFVNDRNEVFINANDEFKNFMDVGKEENPMVIKKVDVIPVEKSGTVEIQSISSNEFISFVILSDQSVWARGHPYLAFETTMTHMLAKETKYLDFFSGDYGVPSDSKMIHDIRCNNKEFVSMVNVDGDVSFCVALIDYWVYSWGVISGGGNINHYLGRQEDLSKNIYPYPVNRGEIEDDEKVVFINVARAGTKLLTEKGNVYAFGYDIYYTIDGNNYFFEGLTFESADPMRLSHRIPGISYIGNRVNGMSNFYLKMIYKCNGIIPTSPTACDDETYCIDNDKCVKVEDIKKVNLKQDLTYVILISSVSFVGVCIVIIIACIIFGFCVKRFCKTRGFDDLDIKVKNQEMKETKNKASIRVKNEMFEIEYDQLKVDKKIGAGGSNSVIFVCKWKGSKVAFKCFKSSELFSTEETYDEFEKEVSIFVSLSHPHILKCYGATLKPPRIGIVMEYCAKGDLKSYFQKNKKHGLDVRLRILSEICDGMTYLHERRIFHRDIKSENILLTDQLLAKIMDFGASKFVERKTETKTKRVGTCWYMSPEVVLGGDYTEKCDVFSFGIMCFEIVSNNFTPYGKTVSSSNVEYKIANNPDFRPNVETLPKNVKKLSWLMDIIQTSWQHEPNNRKSFSELHDILQKHGNNE